MKHGHKPETREHANSWKLGHNAVGIPQLISYNNYQNL